MFASAFLSLEALPLLVLLGLLVGFIVGLTGVGGGSLMTPALMLGVGVPPAIAVGTDLLYATATKASGVVSYIRAGLIDRQILRWLCLGSLPGAAGSMLVLHIVGSQSDAAAHLMKALLGVALVLTAVAVIFRAQLARWAEQRLEIHAADSHTEQQRRLTILSGLVIGVLVAWTSVGAGAIGTAALLILHRRLSAQQLVATEVAHAVPLTLLTGLGHLGLGHVDFGLLAALLLGSIPGALLGAQVGRFTSDRVLRNLLAGLLGVVGVRLMLA